MLPVSLRATALVLLSASTTTALSVSLASFVPRLDNLPQPCSDVYTTAITGCTPDDFKQGATCSAACVRGLAQIGDNVKRSCADVDVGELSIIGVFQNDLGIPSLCPGVVVTTIGSGSVMTSTTMSTVARSTTRADTTSSTNSAAKTTSTPSPSASSTGGSKSTSTDLVMDPNATATKATMTVVVPPDNTAPPKDTASPTDLAPTKQSTRPQETVAPGAQLSNAFSGGGSPFDIVATGSSNHLDMFDGAAVALLAVTLLFVVCA
ncbi:hypothetical protein ACJQWK_07433 [Exserohilum turcicum]|uniref:Uncharacterized protein n=1 Tax=Exserohilum turcicum (strain 28A) TaxID=671987 RepID=R0J146_EXST2|nr:uncharacterized protein SETTUDRAFT_103201 [Exserohilum turcica Et28A]EOA90501.1 hypothetical protein SETTUDRAFT_103201 [Exserohilum turcica Et28A]